MASCVVQDVGPRGFWRSSPSSRDGVSASLGVSVVIGPSRPGGGTSHSRASPPPEPPLPPLAIAGNAADVVRTALGVLGTPYVWGGTSDGAETEFGVTSRGGYDCSGFVWRVYKLQSYPNEGNLASTLKGRTTYTMSVEVPRSKQIPFSKLQPADVVFFGTNGAHSSGSQIFHTGIYVGNGWFIQSSDYGVALAQLSGWYKKRFAWARRPLREAGLEP